MSRRRAYAAIAIAALAVLWVRSRISVKKPPGHDRPRNERQCPADQCCPNPFADYQVADGEQREHHGGRLTHRRPSEEPPWQTVDRLTYYLDWLTFALVVVGIAGLALTYKLERPWLIPLVSDENTESIGQMFRRVAAKDDLLIPEVCLAIANHGRVPAWIIERYIDLRTFEGELPADPPYRPEDVERPAPTPVPDAKPVQQVSRVLFYGPDSLARVNDGETRLVFFGYVKYRGIWGRFGRTMETRFCWLTTRKVVSGRPGGLPDRPIIRFEHGGPRNWTRYT